MQKTPKVAPVASPVRILQRLYYGQPYNSMLSQLVTSADIQNRVLNEQGWTGRRVMGFKLPEWQRATVWTDEQCLKFIESIWLGVNLGTYMVNMTERRRDADLILLDGQQRLRAVERYLADELAMTGEDGNGYFWSELEDIEKAHFLRIPFPWIQTQYLTDEELRGAYNRHNFGGTAHAAHERA
jgi:hypothetical protein